MTMSVYVRCLEDEKIEEITECSEDEMAEQLFCWLDKQKAIESLMLTSNISPPSTTFAKIVLPFLVKQVQDLRLQFIELDDSLAIILGQALSQNKSTTTTTRHLTELRIQISGALSTRCGFVLAKGLSNNPQLSILRLCFRSHFYTERVDYAGVFWTFGYSTIF